MGIEKVKDTLDRADRKMVNFDCDGYEIFAYVRDHALTRFANSVIHQQVASKATRLRIRAYKGKRLVSVRGTADPTDIDKLIETVASNLKVAPEIPHFQGFIENQSYSQVNSMGKVLDEAERGEVVDRAISASSEIDPRSSLFGKVETLRFYYGVKNSTGLEGNHSLNYTDYKIMSIIEENGARGFGREVDVSREKVPNIEAMVSSAVKISQDTLRAKSSDPGEYEVVLRPQAASELLTYSMFGLSAFAFHQGNSAYSDRIGERILGENLTIEDRPLDPQSILASPFDGEGVAKQNQTVIENGAPMQVSYTTLTASEFLGDKTQTSGHEQLPYSDYAWGPSISLAVKGGTSSEEQMIEDTKKGLLVQTFWYSNPVNMVKGVITGLTRDGLYLVEDGEIKHAVRNMRYTDSFLSFYNTIEQFSKEQYSLMRETSPVRLPMMKLGKLRFTGQSKH